MSDAFLKRFGNVERPSREEIRAFLKYPEPERDSKGKILYVTEQAHKDSVDINKIVKKYSKTGLIEHINHIEAAWGTLDGKDFKDMMDKITGIQEDFDRLPSPIRNKFNHNPEKMLAYLADEKNTNEAIELGLLKAHTKIKQHTTEPTP